MGTFVLFVLFILALIQTIAFFVNPLGKLIQPPETGERVTRTKAQEDEKTASGCIAILYLIFALVFYVVVVPWTSMHAIKNNIGNSYAAYVTMLLTVSALVIIGILTYKVLFEEVSGTEDINMGWFNFGRVLMNVPTVYIWYIIFVSLNII